MVGGDLGKDTFYKRFGVLAAVVDGDDNAEFWSAHGDILTVSFMFVDRGERLGQSVMA